jgi:hypothetical protein
MNGWNRATSYAANVKIHRIAFPDSDTRNRAYDLLQCDDAFEDIHWLIREFDEAHGWAWQVGFNGRSSGYMVLYQGGRKETEFKSYCTACGQKNFKTVEETGNRKCGVCSRETRRNFDSPHMQSFSYPGKGLDMDEDFSAWDVGSLKSRVKLVMEFDELVEHCIHTFVEYCQNHKAEEETVMVPKKVIVAKEI